MVPNNHAKFETFSTAFLKIILKGTYKSATINEAFFSALETMAKMSNFNHRVKLSKLFLKKHPMGY